MKDKIESKLNEIEKELVNSFDDKPKSILNLYPDKNQMQSYFTKIYATNVLSPITYNYCIKDDENVNGENGMELNLNCVPVNLLTSLDSIYNTESFDVILAIDVLPNESEFWKLPVIFYDLLKDNGKLVVGVPINYSIPDNLWSFTYNGIDKLFGEFFDMGHSLNTVVRDNEGNQIFLFVVIKKKGKV